MWGALSLTRGRACRFPESLSSVISLLPVCTIYILHIIKFIHKSSGSGQEHRINGRGIRCADHATPSIRKS
jgi:hypothetical protein